jgi:hypothetical protein
MIAVRSVQEVIAGAMTVKLPAHFAGRRVEVIVLPMEENGQESELLQSLLLTAPTLSDDELQGFAQVRECMNQWTFSEFWWYTEILPLWSGNVETRACGRVMRSVRSHYDFPNPPILHLTAPYRLGRRQPGA